MNTEPRNKQSVSHRYGRGMLFLFWIFIMMLGYLFFDDLFDDFINPNQAPRSEFTEHGVTEVTLLRNRYGHYVTAGSINNQPVVFMLDTGASSISIPSRTAHNLNLRKGSPYRVQTANGTVTVYHTKLDEVSIGDIALRNVDGHINPHMGGEDILLGMSFLKQLDFRQSEDRLILTTPAHE